MGKGGVSIREDESYPAPVEAEHHNDNSLINRRTSVFTFPLFFVMLAGNSGSEILE
jgi:hypothetical protein